MGFVDDVGVGKAFGWRFAEAGQVGLRKPPLASGGMVFSEICTFASEPSVLLLELELGGPMRCASEDAAFCAAMRASDEPSDALLAVVIVDVGGATSTRDSSCCSVDRAFLLGMLSAGCGSAGSGYSGSACFFSSPYRIGSLRLAGPKPSAGA